MPPARPEDFVRHFRENGLKLLLQEPGNLRELLSLLGSSLISRLDYLRMKVDATTYVAADYRHLVSDLVLKVPFRTLVGGLRRTLTLYILIEHQSEPDRFMTFRVLEYVIQIYKGQFRAWERRGRSAADFRFQPVLPIVLYTGSVRWDEMPRLVDLIYAAEELSGAVPDYRPLFLSLPGCAPATLETSGGYFGWVLELIQRRHARPEEFHDLVRRVVAHLDEMTAKESGRWLLLLSYLSALIYHDRPEAEREELRRVVVAAARTERRRREVEVMTRTIAEALRDEGRQEGAVSALQTALLDLLRTKFGRVPRAAERAIRATDDDARLRAWLVRSGTAATLAEVQLGMEAEA